jgi:hypothetical protein
MTDYIRQDCGEIKPRMSLWAKISPVALGISSAQLEGLSTPTKVIAIRAAAAQLGRVADDLEELEQAVAQVEARP